MIKEWDIRHAIIFFAVIIFKYYDTRIGKDNNMNKAHMSIKSILLFLENVDIFLLSDLTDFVFEL